MRLGDLDALKEVINANHYLLSAKNNSTDYGMFTTGIMQAIDNAPTVEPDVNCSHCDYFKFSQSFIENVVKFMTDYNIETVEDLMKELNHINELLGGKQ